MRRPIGVVEAVGRNVRTIKSGQVVVMPFAFSDGNCMFCDEGLPAACVHGGFFGVGGDAGGAQAEALRIPHADRTLLALSVGEDDLLMASPLTLPDVMGTGRHAAVTARVRSGHSVPVVGDDAVGLCGVVPAKRLGAEEMIIMGRHADWVDLAQDFGAIDAVSERGTDAIKGVTALIGGFGGKLALFYRDIGFKWPVRLGRIEGDVLALAGAEPIAIMIEPVHSDPASPPTS